MLWIIIYSKLQCFSSRSRKVWCWLLWRRPLKPGSRGALLYLGSSGRWGSVNRGQPGLQSKFRTARATQREPCLQRTNNNNNNNKRMHSGTFPHCIQAWEGRCIFKYFLLHNTFKIPVCIEFKTSLWQCCITRVFKFFLILILALQSPKIK